MSTIQTKEKTNWLLFVTILAVFFALLFNSSAVAISVVTIKHNLHINFVIMEWVLVAYFTVLTCFVGIFGQCGDRFGSLPLFLGGGLVAIIGIIILSASHGPATLMVGRIIQGIGVAMLVPNSIGMVKRSLPEDKLQFGLRIWAAVVFLSYSAGVLLGALMSMANWRLNFWVLYLVLVPGLVIIYKLRHHLAAQELAPRQKFDYIGTLLLLAATVCNVFLFTLPPIYHWTSGFIITMIVLSPILTCLFLWTETKVAAPIFNLQVCKNFDFLLGLMFVLLSIFALFAFFYSAILYSQSPIWNYSSLVSSGAKLLPAFVPIPLLSFYYGALQKRFSQNALLIAGWVLMSLGVFLLLFVYADTTYVNLWWRYVMLGCGMGLLYPAAVSYANSSLPANQSGLASGLMVFVQVLAAMLGVSISQVWYVAAFNSMLDRGLHHYGMWKYDHFKILDAVHTSHQAIYDAISHLPFKMHVWFVLREAISNAFAYGCFTGAIAAFIGLFLTLVILYRRRAR